MEMETDRIVMGEYKNTYQRIELLKIRKIELIEQINELHEELYNIDIEIGECEVELAELRDIDEEAY